MRIQCNKCGNKKTLKEFYADKSKASGRSSLCITCVRDNQTRYQKTAKGRNAINAAGRRYRATESGKRTNNESSRRYFKNHPEIASAHSAVHRAVKSGTLQPAVTQKCPYCPAPAIEHHHHKGYAKEHRLHVVPVCKACHVART